MLFKLLTLPVSGPLSGTQWLAEKIAEQAEQQYYNPEVVQAQLMQLELQLDLGQITEEAYMAQEELLLARLKEIYQWQQHQQMGL